MASQNGHRGVVLIVLKAGADVNIARSVSDVIMWVWEMGVGRWVWGGGCGCWEVGVGVVRWAWVWGGGSVEWGV